MKEKTFEIVYFQPPGIRPTFCEAGMIHESDPEYIWYLDEPCKILKSEVKIIPREEVNINYRKRIYTIKQQNLPTDRIKTEK